MSSKLKQDTASSVPFNSIKYNDVYYSLTARTC